MEILPQQIIESKIYLLRGKKVMLDKDLAALLFTALRPSTSIKP